MKVTHSEPEKIECQCGDEELPTQPCNSRRYTWMNASGRVVSRKLTDYECELQDDVQQLQDALFTLSSHYAKIQFRLRQIASASGSERICLLQELERITCQGIDENKHDNELPNLLRDSQSLGNVREKQQQIIAQLRSRFRDLVDVSDACYCAESESSYNLRRHHRQRPAPTTEEHEANCPCIVCQQLLEQKPKTPSCDQGYLSETWPNEEVLEDSPTRSKKKSKSKKKRKKYRCPEPVPQSPCICNNSVKNVSENRRQQFGLVGKQNLRIPTFGGPAIPGESNRKGFPSNGYSRSNRRQSNAKSYSELIAYHQESRRQSKHGEVPKQKSGHSGSKLNHTRGGKMQSQRNSIQSQQTQYYNSQVESRRGSKFSNRDQASRRSSIQSSKDHYPNNQTMSRRSSRYSGKDQESSRGSRYSGKDQETSRGSRYGGKGEESRRSSNHQAGSRRGSQFNGESEVLRECISTCPGMMQSGRKSTAIDQELPRSSIQYRNDQAERRRESKGSGRDQESPRRSVQYEHKDVYNEYEDQEQISQYRTEKPLEYAKERTSGQGSKLQLMSPRQSVSFIKVPSICGSLCDSPETITICKNRRCRGSCAKTGTCFDHFSERDNPDEDKKDKKNKRPVKQEVKYCYKETCALIRAQRKEKEMSKDRKASSKTRISAQSSPMISLLQYPNNFAESSRNNFLVYPKKYVPQNKTSAERRFCKVLCSKLRKGLENQKENQSNKNNQKSKSTECKYPSCEQDPKQDDNQTDA